MIHNLLFVLSFLIMFMYTLIFIAALFSKEWRSPVPILHWWNYSYANTYLTTPAIGYQIYFWSIKLGIIT